MLGANGFDGSHDALVGPRFFGVLKIQYRLRSDEGERQEALCRRELDLPVGGDLAHQESDLIEVTHQAYRRKIGTPRRGIEHDAAVAVELADLPFGELQRLELIADDLALGADHTARCRRVADRCKTFKIFWGPVQGCTHDILLLLGLVTYDRRSRG